jgi:drug/metabolite transporter (DMT)-like permease
MATFRLGSGEWVFLIGCVSYAAYSPAIRLLDRGAPALAVSHWTVLAGFVVLAVWAAPSVIATDWRAVPLRAYGIVLYLAIFTTVVSFFLIQYASTRLHQAKVMAYTFLIPAIIVLTDWLTHTRLPSASVLAGVGVIASAMLVLQRHAR